MSKEKFEITDHMLVPKHIKLNQKEKKEVLEKYNIGISQLPQISIKDPAIKALNARPGDIIRIERNSPTAGKIFYYRGVIGE